MLVGDAFVDLEKGAADIAIRASESLADSDLVGRKLTDVSFGVYCGLDYAIEHGFPTRVDDLNDHSLVGGEGRMAQMPAMAWICEQAPRAIVHTRSSTLTNLVVAVRSGLGIAPLPTLIADHEAGLLNCFDLPQFSSAIHVLSRADMREVPRVRAFIDFLVPHFAAFRAQLDETGRKMQAEARAEVASSRAPAQAERS